MAQQRHLLAQYRHLIIATLILSIACVPVFADSTAASTTEALDTLFREAWSSDGPGGAVLVKRGEEVLLRSGYGMADLEMGVAITPDMVFRLGSITKQFTAALIMQLVEEDKLSLGKSITEYLPDYDTHGEVVTVEHLLTHTSGIPSYTGLEGFFDQAGIDRTTDEMIDLWEELPLEFEPGREWRYNNSGYYLLGVLIERITGQTYAEAVRERIFTPLGMERSYYGGHTQVIPGRVEGYDRDEHGWINAPYLSMTQPYAAGSLLSTVDDLATWQEAFERGEVVSEAAIVRMWTPYRLEDGEVTNYGYGLQVGTYAGEQIIQHGGGINGFRTQLTTVPDEDIVVAILSNAPGGPGPTALAARATALVLGESLPSERVSVDPAVLERYTGLYRIDEETTRAVVARDGLLLTLRGGNESWSEALPASDNLFFYEGSTSHFHFEHDASGEVVAMVMKSFGGSPERAVRTDEPVPEPQAKVEVDEAAMARLAGEYRLTPQFSITIYVADGVLYGRGTGQPPLALQATSELVWVAPSVGAKMTFAVDPDTGEVTSMTLNQGGGELVGERVSGE